MKKNNVFIILFLIFVFALILTVKKNKDNAKRDKNIPVNIAQNKTAFDKNIETTRQNAITNAIQKIEPAVVSVNVIKTQVIRRRTNPFENPFFGFFNNSPYKREIKAIGSGVIVDKEGHLITNSHVVEGATKMKVILSDGRSFDAKIVGTDIIHDIAILKIEGDNLPIAKLGNSSDLIIGEWSIAVGNPYGFLIKDSKPTVTVGVISALNRDFAQNKDGKIYKHMIQTDAAINPGNSGGPLVNVLGEVIGINAFIFSESGGNIGLGFAIPIDAVKKIFSEIIKYGKIREIQFGFKVQSITPLIAGYFRSNSTKGVIVAQIQSDGPAAKAGLKRGDIIIKINNTKINSSADAELAVSDITVGEKIKIKALRKNKKVTISFVAKYK